jgi:hypothetical protein
LPHLVAQNRADSQNMKRAILLAGQMVGGRRLT